MADGDTHVCEMFSNITFTLQEIFGKVQQYISCTLQKTTTIKDWNNNNNVMKLGLTKMSRVENSKLNYKFKYYYLKFWIFIKETRVVVNQSVSFSMVEENNQ